MKKHLFAPALALLAAGTAMAQTPAFPGAEGYGRYTTGGRGGKVIHVTNLNNSGAGSLRAAVSGNDKKTVVFDVGGVIALNSDLSIGGNTTIMGQTAPGGGITLRYYTVGYSGDNIIVRFVRFRRGQELDINDGADATWTRNHSNIILDHCSMSWSIDEVASFYDNRNFTMQWCTVAEALNNAGHDKGAHGYGGIWGGKGASFHHNFLAHLNNRSPRFNGARYAWSGYDATQYENTVMAERVDFRNCIVYNWGTGGCYGGPGGGFINMVNNYYKAGPGTKTKNRITECSISNSGNSDSSHPEMYNLMSRYFINGNYVFGYGEDYDWKGVTTDTGNSNFTDANGFYGEGQGASLNVKLTEAIDAGTVTTHSAQTAFDKVSRYAGASLSRDAQDTRYAEEATSGTATYSGSVTNRPGILDIVADQGGYSLDDALRPAGFDSDNDGIPDEWETANGLNPGNAADATAYSLDPAKYYTNIEVYANSIVQSIMIGGNESAQTEVKEYYPKYTRINGVTVEAINTPEDTPPDPSDPTGQTVIAKGSITWALTSGGIESSTCSESIGSYIASSEMSVGDNLTVDGTKKVNDVTMTMLTSTQKQASPAMTNALKFAVTPTDELFFTPTKLSMLVSRIGTDSGVFDLSWQNDNGVLPIESGADLNRNDAEHGYYTNYSTEMTSVKAQKGESSMLVYLYGVNAKKQTGIANVVIEGTISKLSTGINDISSSATSTTACYNMQGMRIDGPSKGAFILVTKHADGTQTVRKVMGK